MFSHLVPGAKRCAKPGAKPKGPRSDDCVASLSDAWRVPGREIIAAATPHGSFRYALPPSPDAALFLVAASGSADRQLFYVIEHDRPVYAFLDFDCAQTAAYTPASWAAAVRRCAVLFTCFVETLFTLHTTDHEWRFYDASTGTKWSAHAHSRLLFANIGELKDVVGRFSTWLRAGNGTRNAAITPLFFHAPPDIACIMDAKVYTERPFRLPLNRKLPKADNWLRPAYGTAPLASAIDEIRVGFLHPPAGAPVTPLPTMTAVLDMRRALMAVLRVAAVNVPAQVDAALRMVWPLTPAGPCTEQTDGGAVDATERSVIGWLIEASALHFYRQTPLHEWAQRMELVEVAREMARDVLGLAADRLSLDGVTLALDRADAEIHRTFAFAMLVLRTQAWHDDAAVDVNAWLNGQVAASVSASFDQTAAWTAWRREAHQTLLMPENAVTLDCLRLTDVSPFDRR